ncbi:MAG: hypothetical protein HZY79_08675 [Rhodoblastus sp.]|nr:MAG: hypothetical protein HZY79_08675 [Rhodoblastus sp.]
MRSALPRGRRLAGAALLGCAFCVALGSGWGGSSGALAQAVAVEAASQDDLTLVMQLDAEMSSLAGAVGACVQDGGGPALCLCAARPALAALGARAERDGAAARLGPAGGGGRVAQRRRVALALGRGRARRGAARAGGCDG